MIEQILASHSAVYGAGELETVNAFMLPRIAASARIDTGELREFYLRSLASLPANAPVLVDKMPLNFRWVGFIAEALPEARIVHVYRDRRATCWSLYRLYFPEIGIAFAYDQADLAAYYRLYESLMAFWQARFPGRIHNLRYEQLIESQETETRRLLEYCDLPWESACLEFHRTQRPVRTASAALVRQPLYAGSSEKWRDYKAYLQPLLEGLEA